MCGITGFFGNFPLERIGPMTRLVAHRGPDDEGFWTDAENGVAFGHRRLSIIDLSADGRQPMANADGALRITYNGEIYNYRELRAELEKRGYRFRTQSDTETILHLYDAEGDDCVKRLNGIFAFSLWDTKRKRMLIARDHFGIKPLYYSELPGGVVFGSELKSLLVHPEISRELDPQAIHQYLSFIWSTAPHTMLRAVKKLEPGFRLVLENGRVTKKECFYDLPYDGARLSGTRAEHLEQLRELVAQAVRRQLVSDVPVGAFLSGGLDSSSVVAMMRVAGVERPRCYTINFGEDAPADENPHDLEFARIAAKHLNADLREVYVNPDVVDFIEKMVYVLDEPQADPACINVSLIAERTRADGYKVLLSGAGGDDIFTGYRRHLALKLERYWGWLPQPARNFLAYGVKDLGVAGKFTRRVHKYFTNAPFSAQDRLLMYFVWNTEETRRGLYAPDLARSLADYDTLAPLRETLSRIPHERDPLQQMLYLEAKHFLPDHNLNYTDKMSMLHGIETRVPLLDLDLVKFAAQLSPGEKLVGRTLKAAFKDAMRGDLPATIIDRPKTGFGAPLRRWIREDLREMVRDVLSEKSLQQRGLFDPAAVQRLIQSNENKEVDASYLIFSLMCIEMWLRNFTDSGQSMAAA
jgi:asparagine synthase (glutamine-hydrolysing)